MVRFLVNPSDIIQCLLCSRHGAVRIGDTHMPGCDEEGIPMEGPMLLCSLILHLLLLPAKADT